MLTTEALAFVAELTRAFRGRLKELLARRRERQEQLDAGARFDFLPSTRTIRESDWQVAPLPPDLRDRRVEITGPVDRKMIINALNSGANVFMADFEDSTAPTWRNVIDGQRNLRDAVLGTIRHVDPATGKVYALKAATDPRSPSSAPIATLMVRPRGWHLLEKHAQLDGLPLPAALFDFGLFFFHNARALLARGTGPYFYLPKMESHLEARLWNDVFVQAEDTLGLSRGTIKATVLIETLPAAFEMDEILYELREHSAGLNCGRWDYIFSFIKKLGRDPAKILPDRAQVTMDQAFLRAYTQLLVKTCHRRGVHAMGGMAAQIPIKDDPEANRIALEKVRADKLREVRGGHDGTWVAHPGLVAVAREVFDAHMKAPNQIAVKHETFATSAEELCMVPDGTRTEAGLRHNISVGVQYLESWLRGSGCVPIHHLMEDAATAEISRSQVWQWLHHQATLDDGQPLTAARFKAVLDDELAKLHARRSAAEGGLARTASTDPPVGRFPEASELFERLVTSSTFEEFLTLPAYDLLLSFELRENA